jgi:hypothetical protein
MDYRYRYSRGTLKLGRGIVEVTWTIGIGIVGVP